MVKNRYYSHIKKCIVARPYQSDDEINLKID